MKSTYRQYLEGVSDILNGSADLFLEAIFGPSGSEPTLKLVTFWHVSSLHSWVKNGGEIPLRLKHQTPTKLPLRWQSHMR